MHWGDVAELHDWFLRPKQSLPGELREEPQIRYDVDDIRKLWEPPYVPQ